MIFECPYNKTRLDKNSSCESECDKRPFCVRANEFSMGELVDRYIIIKGKKLFCGICEKELREETIFQSDLTFRLYKSGGIKKNGIWGAREILWYQYYTFTMFHVINTHHKIPYDFPFSFPFVSKRKVFFAEHTRKFMNVKVAM